MAAPVLRESKDQPFLFLPPGWASVELVDEVVLFAGSAAVRLGGSDAASAMRELLPSLSEGRETSCSPGQAPAQSSVDFDALVESLREAGALYAAPDPGLVRGLKRRRGEQLAGVGLRLSGGGDLARLCAEALSGQGIGRLRHECPSGAAESGLSVMLDGSLRPELRVCRWAGEIVLGPWPRNGEAGCWRCAALRRQANAPFDEARPDDEPVLAAGHRAVAAAFLAKEIADSLSADPAADRLAGRLAGLDLRTFEVSRRQVLPAPGCPECGGPRPRQRAAEVDHDRMVEELAELVDDKVGVIHALVLESPESTGVSQPRIATAVTACRPDGACPPTRLPAGWGKGTTPLAAVLSATGEALERYAASIPDPSRLVRARLGQLPPAEAIDPREYPLFHEAQYRRPGFPYVEFDPDIEHPWLLGRRLWDGGPAWIPALFCYLSMTIEARQNFCSGSSNGLAAHPDPEEAALRAVMELVERDAFLAAWRSRQGGVAIAVDGDWDPELLAVLDGIARLGAEPLVVMLEGAGGFPVAVCLAFGDGVNWPGVTLGLGADPCARTAIRQAVLEQGQTGPYLRGRLRAGAAIPRKPADVREMLDHALYYLPKDRAEAFAFLRQSAAEARLAELPAAGKRSLEACGRRLRDSGVRVLLADVTSADLELTPFRVMRAVSPDLQPISFGHGLDRVLTRRLQQRAAPIPEAWVSPIW